MPWGRFDDAMPTHPKFVDRSPEAKLVFMLSVLYCARELTDGKVGRGGENIIFGQSECSSEVRANVRNELIAANLWELGNGDLWVHDYLDYNPTREQVLRTRETAKERMRRLRSSEVRANVRENMHESGERSGEVRTAPDSRFPIPDSQTPVPNNTSAAQTTRGSRLPMDWELPDEWRKWAEKERPDLDIDKAAAGFADYWHSIPGKSGAKLNWFATWRNRIRDMRLNGKGPPAGTTLQDLADDSRRSLEAQGFFKQ